MWRSLLAVVLVLGCSKKEIGEPCEEASECDSELCQLTQSSPSRRTTCTKHCMGDADCGSAGTCIGGTCEVACSSQADCPDETLCRGGLCAVECRSQDDCVNATCPAAGQVCEQ